MRNFGTITYTGELVNSVEVRQLYCNGKSTKGTIDLSKYRR